MSLYSLSRGVAELLAAKKFPLKVHYGPERMHREKYPENVVIFERDREANDTIGAARGVQANPRKLRSRGLAGKIHIYARSSKGGAQAHDHEDLCEKWVDAVHVALVKWAEAMRSIEIPITESRFLSAQERLQAAKEHAPGATDPEAKAIEQWPGVVYRIKLFLPRALLDLDYAGEGLPTAALGGIASRTDTFGPDGEPGGTGCGGP